MKKLLSLLCVSALTGAFCTACAEPKFEERDVPFIEYSLEYDSVNWINLNYYLYSHYSSGNQVRIISSDEELEAYVTWEHTAIDFSKKTLILAYGATPSSFYEALTIGFTQISNIKYRLEVSVRLYDTDAIDRWFIAIVTDKIDGSSKFEVDVEFPDVWPE